MKRYYLPFALLVLLAGCTSETFNTESLDNEFVSHVTIMASDFEMDDATRTSLELTSSGLSFTWAESDVVGIFPNAGDQVKFPMTKGAGTKTANFDGGGWALKGNYTYAAYYPFSKENYEHSYTALPISYKGQTQPANNSTAGLGAYDYMVATASTPESGNVTFNFQHIGSVLYLQLTTPDAATFTKLTLSADEAIFTTEATVNISNGTLTPTATSKEITLDMNNISVNAGGTLNAWMLIAPVDATGKTLKATLTTSTSKTYSVDLTGKYFQTGRAYKLDGTLKTTIMQYVGCATTYDQILGNPEFAYNTVAGTWNSTNLKIFNNLTRFHLFILTTESVNKIAPAIGEYDLSDLREADPVELNGVYYTVYVLRGLRTTDFELTITTATEEPQIMQYVGCATTYDQILGNPEFAYNTVAGTWNSTNLKIFNNLTRFHLFILTTESVNKIAPAIGEYDLSDLREADPVELNGVYYTVYVLRGLRTTDFELTITTATEEVLTYYIGFATAENLTSGNVIGNPNFAINTANNTIEITGERLYKYTGCDLGNGDLASGTFFFFCCLDTKTLTEWHEENSGLNDDHIVVFNEVQNGITLGNEHYKVYYIQLLTYDNLIYKFIIN